MNDGPCSQGSIGASARGEGCGANILWGWGGWRRARITTTIFGSLAALLSVVTISITTQ